jgi:hypothetical protein
VRLIKGTLLRELTVDINTKTEIV